MMPQILVLLILLEDTLTSINLCHSGKKTHLIFCISSLTVPIVSTYFLMIVWWSVLVFFVTQIHTFGYHLTEWMVFLQQLRL